MKSKTKAKHGCCYPETKAESVDCKQERIVVTESKKVELKKKGSSAGKLLRRLFRANSGFQQSVSLQERDIHVGFLKNNHHEYQREIKNELLEAERKKAEAMTWQRRNIIC